MPVSPPRADFSLTALIAAPPERVWRALCDPREVIHWDTSVIAALDAPADYPKPGQHVHWRCRPGLGPFTLLRDSPHTVEPNRRLASLLDLGPCHIDETYDLVPQARDTHLDLALEITYRPALLTPILQRLFPPASIRDGFLASLANLKHHCETS